MSSENPYQAPQSCEPEAAAGRAARGGHIKHDVLIIVLSVLCLMIVGGGGSYLSTRFALEPGQPKLVGTLPAIYWIGLVTRISGGLTGQFIAGLLLGRYLKRVNPRHVLLGIALYIVGLHVVDLAVLFDARDALWLDSVGPVGAVVQIVAHAAVLLGTVAFGIWLGRKEQRKAEQKAAKRDTEPRDVEKARTPDRDSPETPE